MKVWNLQWLHQMFLNLKNRPTNTNMWAKIGVKVNLQFFETSNLNQDIIRPRKYDALLFGEIVGRDMDLFAFWHSSQRNDPGLNIASYTNIKTDKILEGIRKMSNEKKNTKIY